MMVGCKTAKKTAMTALGKTPEPTLDYMENSVKRLTHHGLELKTESLEREPFGESVNTKQPAKSQVCPLIVAEIANENRIEGPDHG